MKLKSRLLRLFLLSTFTASVLLTGCGGEKQEAKASDEEEQSATTPEAEQEPEPDPEVEPVKLLADPAAPSAVPSSFAEVTAQLDQGGDVFGYLATDSFLGNLNKELDSLKALFNKQADSDEEKELIDSTHKVITALIGNSGLQQLSGVGVSSVPIEEDLYRTKFVLHHREGDNTGYLWKLFGSEPQYLSGLDLLPTTTAAAGFSEFDLAAVWRAFTAEIETSGSPEMKQAIQGAPAMIQAMTQMSIDDLFAAMGKDFGFIVTLDDSQMMPLPLPSPEPMQIPSPGALLVMKPGNDTLFTRIEAMLAKNPMVQKATNGNQRTFEFQLPLPIPNLKPTLLFDGEHLIVGTSGELIQEALSVNSGQSEGFKDTEEFKRLARVLPNYGNGFSYFSKQIADLSNQLRQIGSSQEQMLGQVMELMETSETYLVSQVTPKGLVWTGVSSVEPASTLLDGISVSGVSLLAGMTLPAVAKAREKAQEIQCRKACIEVQSAKTQWALKNKKTGTATVTIAELIEAGLLNGGRSCPAGGPITVGPANAQANCPKHNHLNFPRTEESK
ncbi:MAG: hypothetical protein ACPGVU_09770 [Limisphaerales bacterium]